MTESPIAYEGAPAPRRDRNLEAWIAASAVGHALLFAFALLAPPPASVLVLDGSAPAHVLPPIALAPLATPSFAPPEEAAHRAGTPPETSEPPGRARGRRRSHEVDRRTRSDARDVLDSLAEGLAVAAPTSPSPYTTTSAPAAPGISLIALLSGPAIDGIGLDMIGTGRGAGGVLPASPTGSGGLGMGSSCGDEEVVIPPPRRVSRDVGCVAGPLGVAIGMARMRSRESAATALPSRCTEASPCPVPTAIAIGPVTAYGGLTRDVVRRIVSRGRPALRGCYQQGLVTRPDLHGRVTVRWLVSPTGEVMSAAIDSAASDLHSDEVEQCIARAVSRWTFPASESPTAVTFPFVLETSE